MSSLQLAYQGLKNDIEHGEEGHQTIPNTSTPLSQAPLSSSHGHSTQHGTMQTSSLYPQIPSSAALASSFTAAQLQTLSYPLSSFTPSDEAQTMPLLIKVFMWIIAVFELALGLGFIGVLLGELIAYEGPRRTHMEAFIICHMIFTVIVAIISFVSPFELSKKTVTGWMIGHWCIFGLYLAFLVGWASGSLERGVVRVSDPAIFNLVLIVLHLIYCILSSVATRYSTFATRCCCWPASLGVRK
jgi:hypothetical protein